MPLTLLTVTELAVKYPACYDAPERAWQRHLLTWRQDGTLRPSIDWKVYIKKKKHGPTPIFYAEYSVCRLVYLGREQAGFCHCIWIHHRSLVEGVLDSYTPTASA